MRAGRNVPGLLGRKSVPAGLRTARRRMGRPESAVALGVLLACCGDSQTQGRTPNTGVCLNPMEAARLLLNENLGTSISSWGNLGQGGSSLAETTSRYLAYGSRGNRSWVHSQESGEISPDQDTLIEYGEVLKAHFRAVKINSPNAVISTETPNSFNRTTTDRNWDPREQFLRDTLEQLWEQEGIRVYLAEVNAVIEALEVYDFGGVTITPYDLWYQEDEVGPPGDGRGPWAHYTEFGNFVLGAEYLYSLGYPVTTWATTSITDVSAPHKTATFNVIASIPRP